MTRGRRRLHRDLLLLVITAGVSPFSTACRGGEHPLSASYDVTDHFPHDSTAYTQGLLWADGILFESTGLYGHSEVRRVALASGRVLASRPLPANRFGEGLALLNGRLYQLTWKEGVAYTYDAASLAPGDSFHYAGEGLGARNGWNLVDHERWL